MKPDESNGPEMFAKLLRKANRAEAAVVLCRLGRHVLARNPPVAGLEDPDQDDEQFLSSFEQHPWVDFQLLDTSPEQRLLDSADFDKYDLLLEAWPDGFDKVIFSFGEDDEQHADEIVDTVLQQANEHSIPIKTNAAWTDDEWKAFEKAVSER